MGVDTSACNWQLLAGMSKMFCNDSPMCFLRLAMPMLDSTSLAPSYPRIHHVDEQKKLKLEELAPEEQHEVIKFIDKDKDKHTQLLDLRMSDNKVVTGGLVSELRLTAGAKVMPTVNVDISDGLVNGARGTVEAIIKTGSEVTLVLVKYDHYKVGAKAVALSQYPSQYPEAVPIIQYEAV